MPELTDADKVLRNDTGKRIAAAIESLAAPEADKVSYDNTESGMTADNIQDAVDELKSDIDSVELADLDDVNLTSPQDEDELHYDSATSKWKNIAKKIYEKSASGSLVSFNDGGDNIPLKSLIVNITAVQSGSGTPSPSNIRAISGWSGANIVSTGKNIFASELIIIGTFANGTWSLTGNSETALKKVYNGKFKPNTQYTFSGHEVQSAVGKSVRIRVIYTDRTNANIFLDSTTSGTDFTFTSASGKSIDYIDLGYSNMGSVDITNFQIEEGSSATTYEAPKGTTHTIPFGQTVYGGLLDVIKGVLTITHGIVDMGTKNWTRVSVDSQYYVYYFVPSDKDSTFDFICSCFNAVAKTRQSLSDLEIGTYNSTNAMNRLCVRYDAITTEADFKTAITGQSVIYKLATPTTIQLTPAQVKTLLGLNNIFADTGDISLSYFTQNANAINDIAESNTRTALNTDVPKTDLTDIFVTGTKNNTGSTIAAGTYFYVNGQLALCKSAISANADLTLNTNYELVTAGVLNKLAIKTTTVSGTTDSTGNITSDLAPTNKMILSAAKQRLAGGNQDLAYVSYCYNSGQTKFIFHLTNNDGTIYANKSVVIDVFYIDI